jgi:hypothetical protein
MNKTTLRLARIACAASLVTAAWPGAAIAAKSPAPDSAAAIAIGRTWTDVGVPYSQAGYRDGYRRDCSGFVSMVWGLPENLVTWRIPLVAKRIGKADLRRGDVLLDFESGSKHVVVFEKWANPDKTAFVTLEQTGQDGVDRAIRRVVAYPYRVNKRFYQPWRYVGMDRYWASIPASHLQPVAGYTGSVPVPDSVVAALAAASAADPTDAKLRARAITVTQIRDRQRAEAAAEAARIAATKRAREKAAADARRKAAEAEAARKKAVAAEVARLLALKPEPMTPEQKAMDAERRVAEKMREREATLAAARRAPAQDAAPLASAPATASADTSAAVTIGDVTIPAPALSE